MLPCLHDACTVISRSGGGVGGSLAPSGPLKRSGPEEHNIRPLKKTSVYGLNQTGGAAEKGVARPIVLLPIFNCTNIEQ